MSIPVLRSHGAPPCAPEVCVCVCVCMPKSFKSCSNEVQHLRPTVKRPNHVFWCSGAPSTGFWGLG